MLGFGKNKLKEWAESNNLKYQKEVKFGFFRAENVGITDLIWGQYKNKNVYFFQVVDSTGNFSSKYAYFNGKFYSKIQVEDINNLLADSNYLEALESVFGRETQTEIIQALVAQVYLSSGLETDYNTAKEVFRFLQKSYNSRVSVKDSVVGGLMGAVKSDIKYNSPEAIVFVEEKTKGIEKTTIQAIADAYENLLDIYNGVNLPPETTLQDIDMSKFA
jgi:hypothetical protein